MAGVRNYFWNWSPRHTQNQVHTLKEIEKKTHLYTFILNELSKILELPSLVEPALTNYKLWGLVVHDGLWLMVGFVGPWRP